MAAVGVLTIGGSAADASIWTPLTSGTSDTISAIVYQSPTRLWYATTNGHIASWNGSSFTQGNGITSGENFVDLAFQPDPGTTGLAVTGNGHVWRTTNAGVSWTQLATQLTVTSCTSAIPIPVTELNAVTFASSTTAYLLGNNNTLLKSTSSGATFTEINKTGGTCQAQSDTSTQNLTDATFLPGNPLAGIMVTQDFGTLYGSSNGFTSGAKINGDTVNEFQGDPRVAQDPANPNRVFVVDHAPGGSGCGTLCLVVSDDGGNTTAPARFPNDEKVIGGLYDISSQGGVEVTAGSGGEIFTSVDGANFYNQPADGVLATENWRAEDAFDAAHAAIGGVGGALVITAQANTTPTTTVPISAPSPTPISTPVVPAKQPPPSPYTESRVTVGSDVVTLQSPKECVKAGVLTARISIAPRKRKGKVVLKVAKVIFKVDSKTKKTKHRAPFVQVFHLHLKPGSKHILQAQIFIKTHHGKQPHKTLSNTFTACS